MNLRRGWPAPSFLNLSTGVKTYLAVLVTLAFLAFLPSETNATAYLLLFLLTFPTSVVAYVTTLVFGALLFQDPARNDLIVRSWVLLVWVAASAMQVLIIQRMRLRVLERGRGQR